MDDAARVRAQIAIGHHMRHHIVPHARLVLLRVLIVDVVYVRLHLVHLRLGDGQAQFISDSASATHSLRQVENL